MTSENEFRVGIVGAGNSGSKLHLPVLDAMPGVTVEWICDLDLARASKAADQFSVSSFFSDVNQCPDVDAIALTVPVGLRSPVFEVALDRGWNVLIEKPFAKTVASHLQILDKAKSAGIQVGVMAQRRTYHGTMVASELIRSNILGRIQRVWAADAAPERRSGIDGDRWVSWLADPQISAGGFLAEVGWHLIDNVFQLVNARGVKILRAALDGIDGIDTEVRAESEVTTESGETFAMAVRLTRSKEIRRGISIECDRGTIAIGNYPREPITLSKPDGTYVCNLDWNLKSAKNGHSAVHQHWEGFIQQCRTLRPTVSSAESAVLTTQFIEDVYEQGVWGSLIA